MTAMPQAGDLVYVTDAASPQFAVYPILFRVIRVQDVPTYDGWAWLDGYELDEWGDAVAQRSIFVQPGYLKPGEVKPRPPGTPRPGKRHNQPAPLIRRRQVSDPDRQGHRRQW